MPQSSKKQSSWADSQKLRDSSLHLSQTRVYSERSPIILLEDLYVKVKKFIRGKHLDVNIPIALLCISVVVAIFMMIKTVQTLSNDKKYELYKDIATTLGVGATAWFAMTNLHNEYHHKKRSKASQYIEMWNEEYFCRLKQNVSQIWKKEFYEKYPTEFNSQMFNKCHTTLTELKKTPDGVEMIKEAQSKILYRLKENKDERHEVQALLSFFEHMGQDIKLQVADSDYLKDYFYGIVIDTYEFFRKYIEYIQFDKCNRLAYCNFVYLAQTWEKEGSPPSLPKICQRPLIITSADLAKVQEIESKTKEAKSFDSPLLIAVIQSQDEGE
jgi:hypothetical protein